MINQGPRRCAKFELILWREFDVSINRNIPFIQFCPMNASQIVNVTLAFIEVKNWRGVEKGGGGGGGRPTFFIKLDNSMIS